MDTARDIQRDMYNEWYVAQLMGMQDECERCCDHNTNCPFYDEDQEAYDYEECNRVRG